MTPRPKPHEFVQLQTTLDDRKQAEELIRDAIERRLAACGQLLGPVSSTYWWNGAIEEASEWLCVFKTTVVLAASLERWIIERHPYEVPEVVTVGIASVSRSYGEWIEDETRE
ncbi:MAG: divalent-cation tolerance protein CutA [Candidatus Eisenbacteria sp.]|nr:divalent-cation tolerance protein CutA [Candidatus Eisenbacteria bacterium]